MRWLLIFLALSVSAYTQTIRTYGTWVGAGTPTMFCVPGQWYFQTDGTVGSAKWLCNSSNAWTQPSTAYQSLDADLSALAGNAVDGFWARTGAGTGAARTITAASTKIAITNGAGTAGNPTVDVTEANLTLSSLGGAVTDGQVPNTITIDLAAAATALQNARTIAGVSFNGTANIAIASTGLSDTANLVRITAANVYGAFAQDLSLASVKIPSSITRPGTCLVGEIYFDTDATTGQRFYGCETANTWVLQGDGGGAGGLGDPGANGIVVRTALNTTVNRTITAGSTKISIGNGDGVAANPTVDVTEANLTLSSLGGSVTDGQVPNTITVDLAAAATALQNARTIAGVSFNGTVNIAIPSTGLSDTADLVRITTTNVYGAFAQDFGAVTSLKVPTSAGAAPTANGLVAYDSTANKYKFGANTATKTIATEDGNIATSSALAADGTNCTTSLPRGIDTAGNAQGCADADLTTEVLGILPGANGGTNNGFMDFAGPATSLKTFTLPNASSTILTTNALVTGAQGGTANGFFAVTGPTTSLKTFTFPDASATVLTTNAVVTVGQGGIGVGTLTGVAKGNGTGAFTAATAQDTSGVQYVAGGGTAQAQTATLSPAITAQANGQTVCWLPLAANTAAAPTLAVNGLTATNITKLGATALVANDITTTAVACAILVGANYQLQNPQTAAAGGGSPGGSGTELQFRGGAATFSALGSSSVPFASELRLGDGYTPNAAATRSVFNVGAAIASGSANGNMLGINAPTGFTGNLIQMEVNGTTRYYFRHDGYVSLGSGATLELGSSSLSGTTLKLSNPGAVSLVYNDQSSANTAVRVIGSNGTAASNFIALQGSAAGTPTDQLRINGDQKAVMIGQTVNASSLASMSLYVEDDTATTGVTRLSIQEGAGQSTTPTFENRLANATANTGALTWSILAGIPRWGSVAEPTCNATNRGGLVMVQGGAAVLDTFRVCRKDAADAYSYVAVVNEGTLLNTTYDAAATGNVLTYIERKYLTAAGCANATATVAFDTPTTNAATGICIGTTTTTAFAVFADGSTQVATVHHRLPSDWVSTSFGAILTFTGSASSTNTLDWRVSTACVADTEDPTSPSYNAASTNSAAGPTTTPQLRTSSFTPAVTNCAASEMLYLKIEKVTGDTYVGSGYLMGVELAYTRTQ